MLSQHNVVPAWVAQRREVRPNPLYRYYDSAKSFHDPLTKNDKIMIIRRTGGVGDTVIISCLLQRIHEMYPENHIAYACPGSLETLFYRTPWLGTFAAEVLTTAETILPARYIKSPLYKGYNVIEDVTIPCHAWERTFIACGKTDGGLRWRNRLDVWSNWIGIHGYETAETCIVISDKMKEKVREKYFSEADGPIAILNPLGSERMKSYEHWLELGRQVQRLGYSVYLLGAAGAMPPHFYGTITAKDFAELMTIVSLADLVVTVDTATLHMAGVLKKKTVGLFMFNDGQAYCKYYPTVKYLQLCPTPCLRNGCSRKTCYGPDSLAQIVELVKS